MRVSLAVAIGAVAGFTGIVALGSGVFNDLLPVNRLLAAMVCSLLSLWALLSMAQAWKEHP